MPPRGAEIRIERGHHCMFTSFGLCVSIAFPLRWGEGALRNPFKDIGEQRAPMKSALVSGANEAVDKS